MAEKAPSPFVGLDTSLLRSTRPQPVPETSESEAASAEPGIARPTVPASRRRPQGARDRAPKPATARDTTVARSHDTELPDNAASLPPGEILETVRQRVRTLGKEAATYRFTQKEKQALAEIVYAYKGQGIRTSENEITRVALNYLIEEYRANGTTSILAQVLAMLNR